MSPIYLMIETNLTTMKINAQITVYNTPGKCNQNISNETGKTKS